jgi:cobalt-zinc-cadmium efflux system membrane fusion protein
MKTKAVVLVVCSALVGLLYGGNPSTPTAPVGTRPQAAATEGVVRLPPASLELAGVKVATVQTGPGRRVLRAMGKMLAPPAQTAVVSHALPCRVAEIHATLGEWVHEGQTLLVLECQQVAEAKTEFFKAFAARELAKVNLEREQRLLDSGIGVKKGLVAAEAEHKMAEANLEAAEKRLHVLGFSEERVQQIAHSHEVHANVALVAPIAGKIVASKVIRGGIIDEATEILTIIDPRSLCVDAELYEKDLAKVKIGQKVEIAVPAYPGQVFHGKVTYIADMVDDATRTITVRAEVPNADLRLKPGMFAQLGILLNGDEPMVLAPAAAVLEEGRRKIVFVKQGDAFVRREVQTNAVEGEWLQILHGLAAGEEVVVQGNHQLKSELQRELLEAAHVH